MYTLEDMRNFPLWSKNTFRINYDVDLGGDNHEWRECVTHILEVLKKYYHLEVISEPHFEPKEDFVDLTYTLNNSKIIIGNDFLFSMMWIEAETVEFSLKIQKILADENNLPPKRIDDEISKNSDYSKYNIRTETHTNNTSSTNQKPTINSKNMILNNQLKETGTWKWGILCLVFLAPFFFLSYGFANNYASQLLNVPSIVYDWEKHIPLWAWTIVPYWSIDLFYGLSLLLCWNKFELKQHALRLFTAQLISISCFLLFPLKFSFERPALDGFFGLWFDVLMGFDKPFNQAPSLHIVLLVILWDFFRRHCAGHWKYLVDFWSLLIAVSVLTTWQHHFIDIPTGLLVGALCLWLFPITAKSPFKKDALQILTPKHLKLASYYFIGSILLVIPAILFKSSFLWLIYPSISLFLVACAYLLVRPHFFQKQADGNLSHAAKMLFAPYLIFAWLNSRIWTRKHPEDSAILKLGNTSIFLGRIPSANHTQQYQAVFDCVAELPVHCQTGYDQYPGLDLIPLQVDQLVHAVESFNQLIQSVSNDNSEHKILIFCALGYSRSSATLCAWLLQQQHAAHVQEAIQIVQSARPWVKLNDAQIKNLNTYQLKLKGLAP